MIFIETDSDPAEWLMMPLLWNDEEERQDWAQLNAEVLWKLHKKRPKQRDINSLAKRLDMLAEGIPGKIPAQQVFLYAPDPRRLPAPFFVAYLPAEGDRTESLRGGVQADEDSPVRPVEVDVFATERLGPGLRSLRYWATGEGQLMLSLNFAWRLEDFGVDLSVRTVTDDPGWLAAHLDECDAFVHSLWARDLKEAQQDTGQS